MIDHVLGRPSPTLRRSQIFLVLFFWVWRLYKGDGAPRPTRTTSAPGATPSYRIGAGPGGGKKRAWFWRIWVSLVGRRAGRWMGTINLKLRHFTPYQLILGTLTILYALRHLDDLFGIGAPEPLARLYSRSYYRATYVNTAFDAGFASAMTIRPKWLKDLCSVLFSFYYLVRVSDGDEVLRRFRALCSVEMLRVTWEKTNNRYIRLLTTHHRPRLTVVRHVSIPRPPSSSRAALPPVKGMLFFHGTEAELQKSTKLVVDFPGGGFIAMGPECHEERLRRWAKRTGKPVLGIDYGKAPEYPYPYAIEEGFDAYRTLMETRGKCIGIDSGHLGIVLTGDSAGGNICTTIVIRILEHHTQIPRPISMILAYPALDFNYTSWMSPANLRVLRVEQSEAYIPGILQGKDHLRHKTPLSVVDDIDRKRGIGSTRERQRTWGQTVRSKLPSIVSSPTDEKVPFEMRSPLATNWQKSLPRVMSAKLAGWIAPEDDTLAEPEETISDGSDSEEESITKTKDKRREQDKSLKDRVKTPREERRMDLPPIITSPQPDLYTDEPVAEDIQPPEKRRKAPIGTRLTMTSRVGYFQDRVISPSMMRAMAILYVGPRRNPDFGTDYYISPLLSPSQLLAHFPPVYLICGERDPFVDDTVIFAGRIREAKRRRRAEADSAAQSKSAKFGEGLRMSTSKKAEAAPDHILRESDDDWVQMRIIEGWGHGFMQMAALMREVDSVLTEMADWIDESFARADEVTKDMFDIQAAHAAAQAEVRTNAPVLVVADEHLLPSVSTHVKPVRDYKKSPSHQPLGNADLGAPLSPDKSDDSDEGVIAFTPKSRRRTPPSSKFIPVVRRPSKETLDLHRSGSAPTFDVDETGSSGEAMTVRTPPLGVRSLPGDPTPRGSGAFAFFGPARSKEQAVPRSIPPPDSSLSYGSSTSTRRLSANSAAPRPTNSLVAAAVAGARAASPALAAAGLAPQKLGDVSEAELMRRRRMEAVYGMGETDSALPSDEEDLDPHR